MRDWIELFARISVCVLINVAFIWFIARDIVYPELFVAALTASWGVLGITAYSGATRHNRERNLKAEIREVTDEVKSELEKAK